MKKIEVGKKLVMLRELRSREEVANAVGISVSALQMYENGKRMPRDEIKVKLAYFYNVSVQDLFFEYKPHESCGDDKISTA